MTIRLRNSLFYRILELSFQSDLATLSDIQIIHRFSGWQSLATTGFIFSGFY